MTDELICNKPAERVCVNHGGRCQYAKDREPQPPNPSALIGLLGSLKSKMVAGFKTCNSADGKYTVEVEFKTLKEAQEFNRVLVDISIA